MISNDDKMKIIIARINNVESSIISYIEHADVFQEKYSLDDVLLECNIVKSALIQELELLGGTWPAPLD